MHIEQELIDEFRTLRKNEKDSKTKNKSLISNTNLTIRKKLMKILQCPICKTVLKSPTRVKSCGHYFCKDCLEEYYQYVRRECPVCNITIKTRRYFVYDMRFNWLIKHYELLKLENEENERLEKELEEGTLKINLSENNDNVKSLYDSNTDIESTKSSYKEEIAGSETESEVYSDVEDNSNKDSLTLKRRFEWNDNKIDDWSLILGYND